MGRIPLTTTLMARLMWLLVRNVTLPNVRCISMILGSLLERFIIRDPLQLA